MLVVVRSLVRFNFGFCCYYHLIKLLARHSEPNSISARRKFTHNFVLCAVFLGVIFVFFLFTEKRLCCNLGLAQKWFWITFDMLYTLIRTVLSFVFPKWLQAGVLSVCQFTMVQIAFTLRVCHLRSKSKTLFMILHTSFCKYARVPSCECFKVIIKMLKLNRFL